MITLYSYIAYTVMTALLVMAITFILQGRKLRKRLNQLHQKTDDVIEAPLHLFSRSLHLIPVSFVHQQQQSHEPESLEKQVTAIFLPMMLNLGSLRSAAPALGLFFTVVSIMISFSVFSSTGDIKQMFAAASVGFGTTAIGAITMVVAKLGQDRILIPLATQTESRFKEQIRQLTVEMKRLRKHPTLGRHS